MLNKSGISADLISSNLHRVAKPYGMTQNWNYNSKDNYEDFEAERKELETSFKKPKNGKAPGEDNILLNCASMHQTNLKQGY